MKSRMPTTMIGIQEWFIGCLNRSPHKGWRLYRARATKTLVKMGFSDEMATTILHDAFDMYELERLCTKGF